MTRSRPNIDRRFTDPTETALGRRNLLALGGAGLLTLVVAGCGGSTAKPAAVAEVDRDDHALSVDEAHQHLVAGNARYVAGTPTYPDQSLARRATLGSKGQKPFVTVLACADSRVPPELVFDQGLGDMFVVRSAGEVVDRAVLGSLQFAVAEFHTPLLVVLGHSKCGAVKATMEALDKKSAPSGTDVDALVEAIVPAVDEAEKSGAAAKDLVGVAVADNAARVVKQLSASKVLSAAIAAKQLKIVSAVYDTDTGQVHFA
jgi:carbonic anhydrase